ncbi:unnamed protein product [Cutaneotrichosporon oleaginosum]
MLAGVSGLPTPDADDDCRSARTPKPGEHAAFATLEDAGIDLAALPLPYLDNYPYPAFVLVPGVPVNKEKHGGTFSLHNIQLLSPIWSNPCWRRISGGCENLLECLSAESARRLSFWLSGAFGAFTSTSWSARRAEHADENNPMCAPPTVTLEFELGARTRLTLAKTLFPLYQTGPDGRSLISTHILAVITATPHGRLEFAPRPLPSPALSTDSGPTSSSAVPAEAPADEQGKLLYLRHDGSWAPRRQRTGRVSSCNSLLETNDWARSPLGPREQWPTSLQLVVSFVMNIPFPGSMWWGEDMCLVYNQLYAEALPNHPHPFGQTGTASWAELWPALGSLSELVLNGTPVAKEDGGYTSDVAETDLCLVADADGHVREMYRLNIWVPIKSGKRTEALIHLWDDRTTKVVSGRRALLLYTLSERASTCRTVGDFDRAVLETVEPNPRDLPFALLYHVERTKTDAAGPRERTFVRLRYAGGVGVPHEHPAAPLSLDVPMALPDGEDAGSPQPRTQTALEPWPFAEAIETGKPVFVPDCSGIVEGFPVRVWDELPTSAIVIPIVRFTDADLPSTVMVVGLSDRLPWDGVYQQFLRELRLELASHYAAVKTHEDLLARRREGAARAAVQNLSFAALRHELAAMLGLIAGPLDDALDATADGPARTALETSRRNLLRFARGLSALTEMSSIDSRRIKGSFSPVNFGKLVGSAAQTFRPPPDIDYLIECDTGPHDVFVDRDKLERVLFTLVGNAFRFTSSGQVRVRVFYEGQAAVLAVEDTGVGMDGRTLALLNSPLTVQEGIDARLVSLTHAITLARMHGGSLHAECPPTGGSRVTLTLPLGSDHLPHECVNVPLGPIDVLKAFHQSVMDDLAHCQWGWVGSAVPPDPARSFQRAIEGGEELPVSVQIDPEDVVLIVDATLEMRQYLRGIFAPFCHVVEVTSAADALKHMEESALDKAPDLVIADAHLSGMSGFDLVAALRQGSRLQQMLPVIMMTGSREEALPEVAYGADDYLARPFGARELITRAHMQLQLGKKRRALEAAYAQRTQELRILNDAIPVGIYRTTADGWFVYANAMWYELTGYPRGRQVVNWGDYVVEADKETVRQRWSEFLSGPARSVHGEVRFVSGRVCSYTSLRLDGIAGAPTGILGCVVDITDRIKNEELQKQRVEEALRRQAEAEEAKRQQEELIDITSHEIRNPISNMMQCASLVRGNLLKLQGELTRIGYAAPALAAIEDDLEALQNIYNCGLTQERISNDVLSLGKLQLGRLEIFHVATDIVRETSKLVGVFQAEAKMNLVDLSLDIGTGFEDMGVRAVMIDPVRYSQIVTNLVSNAIRFTSNSPQRRVRVMLDIGASPPDEGTTTKPSRTAASNGPLYLFCSVSDTGPGMTPAERATLFQRFSQASAKTHTVFGGSGLGLFVCRKITERMGGRIDVESHVGQGSRFQFFLRVERAAAPATPPGLVSGKREVSAHVLVVEDNVLNCKVLDRQFSKVGIRVESVGNGLEALGRLTKSQAPGATDDERFDVVLMDLEMPIMDGYTATRRLREAEAVGSVLPTAVIAFTGNARHAQIGEKMADFDDVVVKPYRIHEMLDQIERAVREGPKRRPLRHAVNGRA